LTFGQLARGIFDRIEAACAESSDGWVQFSLKELAQPLYSNESFVSWQIGRLEASGGLRVRRDCRPHRYATPAWTPWARAAYLRRHFWTPAQDRLYTHFLRGPQERAQTQQELAAALEYSQATINDALAALERRGVISRNHIVLTLGDDAELAT